MIDIQMSNDKLISRAISIVVEVTGESEAVAQRYLTKFKAVKQAIFAIMSKIDDIDEINSILSEHNGNIREALRHTIKMGV